MMDINVPEGSVNNRRRVEVAPSGEQPRAITVTACSRQNVIEAAANALRWRMLSRRTVSIARPSAAQLFLI